MTRQYVGLDVSLEATAVGGIAEQGRLITATSAASDPQAIAAVLRRQPGEVVRTVLASGQLSTWLARALRGLGLPVVCIDARRAHRALSGRLNKSDPADAEGLAQLARTGWFREVHVESPAGDRLRALLGARDRLIRIRKELEGQVRGTLKTFGIRLGRIAPGKEREGFRHQARLAAADDPALTAAVAALLAAHQAVCREHELRDASLRRSARTHGLIGRMMTVPGVGPITGRRVHRRHRPAGSVHERSQRCRLRRADPAPLSIGSDRLPGAHFQTRRCDAARPPLRGGDGAPVQGRALLGAQELGVCA